LLLASRLATKGWTVRRGFDSTGYRWLGQPRTAPL
jgi:hypothetical protein